MAAETLITLRRYILCVFLQLSKEHQGEGMLYMYVYTYVGKKEGREGVQNGEDEQRLYIFATPSFWDLGSKKF